MSSRLDVALVERGLATSRNRAARLIATGNVVVNGGAAAKPSLQITDADTIEVSETDHYVSRAAHKLLGALEDLGSDRLIAGARCLDAGASTGGFTQVLLEKGAAHVYAVDVGHDQLAEPIAADPRVTNLEGTTIRTLNADVLGGAIDVVVADLSFISLTMAIPALTACALPTAVMFLMVKPQFELQRGDLDHGVVTDPAKRVAALERVVASARENGLQVTGAGQSRLAGPSGNIEFFLRLRSAQNGDARAATAPNDLQQFLDATSTGAPPPPFRVGE